MNSLLKSLGGSLYSYAECASLSCQRYEEKLEKQACLLEEKCKKIKIDNGQWRYKDVFQTTLMANHVAMTTHFLYLFMPIMAC